MTELTASDRVRAFGYAVIAAIYFYLAEDLSVHAAHGLASGEWFALLERSIFLFLLVLGYALMGRIFSGQEHPVSAMGLTTRPGWGREFALGGALGWGMLIASILPLVLSGGLIVTFWLVPRQFGFVLVDLLLLAVASLAEEVAFRGYGFQQLVRSIGPTLATIFTSLFFAGVHIFNPSANHASFVVTFLCGCLLSVAYLRTRALWVCWGWHFAWNASMCVLFGLPVSGITQFSPVIQSNTVGPLWMTGGDYGPEASLVTTIVLLVGTLVVYRATRQLSWQYNQPVIVPGGIPVDLDSMRGVLAPHHPQEESAPPPVPAGSTLVQISIPPKPTDPNQ
jgi:uncharacterized protein